MTSAAGATPPERFLCWCGLVRDGRHGPRCEFQPLGGPLYRCPICERVSEEHQRLADARHVPKCRYYPSVDTAHLERVREREHEPASVTP